MIYKTVILKHLTMANKIANKYAQQNPTERDEILSAAYLGLVKAGHKKKPKSSYVASCIKSEIRDALKIGSHTPQRDRMFLADYLSHSGNLEDRAQAMGMTPEKLFHRLSSITVVVPLLHQNNIPSRQESQLGEMLEVCLKVLPDRLQPAFLLKFRDQYTRAEISQAIGLPMSTVQSHLRTTLDILRRNRNHLSELLY